MPEIDEDIESAHREAFEKAREIGLTEKPVRDLWIYPNLSSPENARLSYFHPDDVIVAYQELFKEDEFAPLFLHEYTHRDQFHNTDLGDKDISPNLRPEIEIDAYYTQIVGMEKIKDQEYIEQEIKQIRTPGKYMYPDIIENGVKHLVNYHRELQDRTQLTDQEIYGHLRPDSGPIRTPNYFPKW